MVTLQESTILTPEGIQQTHSHTLPDELLTIDDEDVSKARTLRVSWIVSRETGGAERLDKALCGCPELAYTSREKIKQAIKAGLCCIDNMPCLEPKTRLRVGQCITLYADEEYTSTLTPSHTPIEVLYEDAWLAVVNKPAGLTVHPCPSCNEETLVHRLLGRFPSLQSMEGNRPGIVHRLDKDTSGLIVIALNEEAQLRLSAMFANRDMHKTYLALVHGSPSNTGESAAPIGRHPTQKIKMAVVPQGRAALSHWHVLYRDPCKTFALASVTILTGRTHQIRVHMAHAGHPLLGDSLYGGCMDSTDVAAKRQMLHAWKLAFVHPFTGNAMQFCCLPPKDMLQTFLYASNTMQRLVLTGLPGSGKSYVAQSLASKGIPMWSADAQVRQLYKKGQPGWEALRVTFGTRFVASHEAEVDTKALLTAIKNEPETYQALNACIHPLVSDTLSIFWQKAEQDGEPLAVAEVPLWFESTRLHTKPDSQEPLFNNVLVAAVHCNDTERHERLRTLRQWSDNTIAQMDAWQWSDAKKCAEADLIVNNTTDLIALDCAITTLLQQLEARRLQHMHALKASFATITSQNAKP